MTKLYCIGVGPGDSQYLTLKAAHVLGEADVVFCPQSEAKKESLALSICQEYINPKAEIVYLVFPMTKDQEVLKSFWAKAVETIKMSMQAKKIGAFITLGDPAIYSTYSYIVDELKDNNEIEVQTIAGIAAFNASAAALNLSLIESEEKMALLPATNISAVENAIDNFETVVLYKVKSHLGKIVDLLKRRGLTKTSYLISNVSSNNEHIQRIDNLEKEEKGYFSTIIIKKLDCRAPFSRSQ